MKLAAAVLLALLPLPLHARVLCGTFPESRPVASGEAYELDLREAEGASEVRIEESRSPAFEAVRIFNWMPRTPPPVFMHLSMNEQRLYYRITIYDEVHRNISPCPIIEPVMILPDRKIRDSFRRSVIPVVHRAEGVVTSLWLFNNDHEALSGRIVFRKAGVPGRSNDPSIAYLVGRGSRVQFNDLLQELNVNGLGSLDIVPDDSSPDWLPVTEVRVRNVSEEASSSGMTVPQVRVSDFAGTTVLTIPAPRETEARTSVGVRTWSSGGSLVVHVEDLKQSRDVDLDLKPDLFRHYSLDELAGFHVETPATIVVTAKGAVVYGMETDPITNESRLRIAFGELEGEKTFVGDFFQ
jgi:hypothetical protein